MRCQSASSELAKWSGSARCGGSKWWRSGNVSTVKSGKITASRSAIAAILCPELGGEGGVVGAELAVGRDRTTRIVVAELGGAERSGHRSKCDRPVGSRPVLFENLESTTNGWSRSAGDKDNCRVAPSVLARPFVDNADDFAQP